MEKRIFSAIIISVALLWLWAAIAPKLFPEVAREQERRAAESKRQQTETASAPATATAAPAPAAKPGVVPTVAAAAPLQAVAAEREQVVTIDTPKYVAQLSNRGAQLISFKLKSYREKSGSEVDLVKSRPRSRYDYPFFVETRDLQTSRKLNTSLYAVTESNDRGARVVQFRLVTPEGVSATKTFRFEGDYTFRFSSQIAPEQPYRVAVGPGIRTLGAEEKDTQVIVTGNGVVQQEGEFDVIAREKGDRLQIFPAVDFVGIEDNYFLTALKPARSGDATLRRESFAGAEKNQKRSDLYAGLNASGGTVETEVFFGPKEAKVLEAHGLDQAMQFGWFGIIARLLLEVLLWINKFTLNYGWAIVVLTIIIKILLYPLQHKSIVSMKKMQKLQPKMEAIKAKYKKARTDPEQRQKMNVEMMKLYQDEKINPMSGCFPILLQLPILWGFYGLLSRAIELRGAPWILWIQDLSDKDPYYITPILMTATMFIQTYITPTTGDPMQRKIFLIMPLIFGFLFKDFPSGLVLYWLVQNILTIIQQLIMNKWWKDHPEELQKA
jgi:YidC/Oxa1 family membrane protein insertase